MTGKILDFITHADAVKAVPLQTKVELYQRITREWAKHLTASETMVLFAVADRTVGWGRREAYFTVKAMVEGDGIYAPLPMSRATIFRSLASLEERGFISRRHVRDAANHEHPKVHFSVNINWKPGMVNLPKRLQGAKSGSHSETSGSHSETSGSHSETLYTVSPTPVSHNDSLVPGSRPSPVINPADVIRAKIATAQDANRVRQAERKMFGGKADHQKTSSHVEAAWRMAVIETFPGNVVPIWTAREKSQAKIAAGKWIGQRDIAFTDFVAWAARNWTAIMRKQFKWMTKEPPPAVPSWGFLIAFLSKFAECHAEGKLEEWLTDGDRTEIEKIMARGMTWEQAVAQHADAKAKGALRGEIERTALEAQAVRHAADLTMDRARKLADYAGNAPVHPRSRAALRMQREAAEAARVPTTIAAPEPFTGVPMLPERNPFDYD